MEVFKLTPARIRVLSQLAEGPIPDAGLVVFRIQRPLIQKLEERGLVKYRPYGKPPSYAITAAGREALSELQR